MLSIINCCAVLFIILNGYGLFLYYLSGMPDEKSGHQCAVWIIIVVYDMGRISKRGAAIVCGLLDAYKILLCRIIQASIHI